jgi:hypothetical protein
MASETLSSYLASVNDRFVAAFHAHRAAIDACIKKGCRTLPLKIQPDALQPMLSALVTDFHSEGIMVNAAALFTDEMVALDPVRLACVAPHRTQNVNAFLYFIHFRFLKR